MSLTKDISLLESGFDQEAKRYNFAIDPVTGDVAFDDTQAYAVMGAALFRRGQWWRNPEIGSDAHQLKNLTSRTTSQAEAVIAAAEKPLVDEGLILEPTVSSTAKSDQEGNRLLTKIDWTTPSGLGGTQNIGS